MNKKSKMLTRLFSALLVLTVLFAGSVPAKATDYTPTVPEPKLYGYMDPIEVEPGQTIDVVLPVRVSGYTIKNPIIKLDLDGTPFTLVSEIKLTREDVKADTNLTMLSIAKVTYLNFQLKVSENARKGTYDGKENILTADDESEADKNGIGVLFTTTDSFNNYVTVRLKQPSKFAIKVLSEKTLPTFSIAKTDVPDMVKPEDAFNVGITIKNNGQVKAEDVRVTLEKINEAGFLPDSYFGESKLGDIKSGATASADFSLRAGMGLTSAVQQVTAHISFKVDGKEYTEDLPVYVQTAGKDDEKQTMIGAVRLMSANYPSVIADGDSFNISLTYKNVTDENVTGVIVQIDGYDNAGFIPDFYYNKTELGDLKAGKSKNATFKFKAAEEIVSGNKPITLKVTYVTSTGSTLTDTVTVYLDVKSKNAAPTTSGMPKLLVTDYSTGVEKLMAGSEFDFSFSVKNSHSTAKAENIKVTVSSTDNTFSIIQGSSSFLIESLAGGETKECSIPLRVKGDVATGGYDINIEFDYEYTGLDDKKNVTSLSNKITETLKIPVYSNDRPMVNNIQVGTWESPKANESTTMSFEFYNMGKSPLYNVTATVEGDFTTNGAMLMIGNVESGSGQTWEMDVTPLMGGTCSGTLIISYEDGNGNPSTYEMPFTSEVQDNGGMGFDDGGYVDDGNFGFDDGNMGFDDGMMGEDTGVKKGLPLWAWIVIGVAGVAVVAAVVVIVIKVRAKKKGEFDLDEDD